MQLLFRCGFRSKGTVPSPHSWLTFVLCFWRHRSPVVRHDALPLMALFEGSPQLCRVDSISLRLSKHLCRKVFFLFNGIYSGKKYKRRDLVHFHSISELKVVSLLEKKLDRTERSISLWQGRSEL